MKNSFSFNINQFNKLFPFYILFNQKLEVESVGVSLEKIFPNTVGQLFSNNFFFKRPQIELSDYDTIALLVNQLLIVECKNISKTSLRGQVEIIEATNQLLFLGSPWFDSMEEVLNHDLLLKDFAHHDPMIDLLHVLKNQEIATSDLKQLLLELNKQKEQLRILSSIAAENTNAVVIADNYGRIEWTNKSFEKITGYTLEEVKGRKPGHILQGPETNLETINYIKRQITSGEPFVCEILNYHKTGSKYWLRLQGQALKDINGKIIKYFAIEEDITKEKQYKQNLKDFEARFRLALEKIGDNVWEHDFRTGKTIFSKTYNSFLGISDEQNKNLEQRWRNSVHKDDLWKIISNEENYKKAKIDSHSTEYRIIQNDGSIKWVLDRGVVIEKDKDGKPLLLIGTHTDISSQKTIEQELIFAKEAAEASTNAKEMFLANMSHEIRTPMNAIVGMANQMSKTNLDSNQQFYLGNIQSAADNLLIVINDILDLSKIEAGKLTLEHIAFQPNQVLERAMIVMMHKAEEKGLSLINSYNDEKLANVLIGDPYRLNQILLNLLSNAIKFTEKGIVDIDCEVVKNDESNQIIKLSVTDSGIGMDEAFIKILFQKFSQEDESVTRKFGGTGLGMSICKNLVELMNGDIEVFSKKGVGTTVVVTIPFEKGNTAMLPIKGTETVNTNLLAGKKILVADDNEMNRLVASSILEQYQSIIIEAENGQEAVDKMRNEYFDIVLMDVQMPVMDGIEATKEIRRTISENVPIIALTAMALKGDDVRLIKEGMSDHLSKPFDEAQLLNIISRWLGK